MQHVVNIADAMYIPLIKRFTPDEFIIFVARVNDPGEREDMINGYMNTYNRVRRQEIDRRLTYS